MTAQAQSSYRPVFISDVCTNDFSSIFLMLRLAQRLNEEQAYILLDRWVIDSGLPLDQELGPDQLERVALYYFEERIHLLKAIEGLLLLSQSTSNLPEVPR
jgi:hypothetical protein